MLDELGRAIRIDFDSALPLAVRLIIKYGTEGFVRPMSSDSLAPPTLELGQNSSTWSTKTTPSSQHNDQRSTRLSCVENDFYSLEQFGGYLAGAIDLEAEAATGEAKAKEEEREYCLKMWVDFVRTGRRTKSCMDRAIKQFG